MKMTSREWIECLAFVGIESAATGYMVGEVVSMVKSPIAKVLMVGTTMAANAYIGYRMAEKLKRQMLNTKTPSRH